MTQPFIFGGNTGMSYDQIQKQRDIANELLRANMSTPQNVGEGLSAIGRALAAKAIDKRATRADADNRKASEARRADAFGMIFGGGGSGAPFSPTVTPAAPPSPGAAVADDTMTALGKTPMRPFRDAIASIESAGSGDYAAVGPTNPRLGRALGRYQIMEANIGPWSREVLGREVTPDEFLANPQIQDAIFDGKFGKYVQQFGPEGAAQAWFAGPGGVGKMDRQDVLGTSVAEYTQKFTNALGGAPAASPAMGNPATIQVIADLLADPYTPPGEKAMLEQAMAMQLQNMDPMRQMEMERARLELDQMRNPQPQERNRIVTGDQAAALGLDPALRYNLTEGPNGMEASVIGGGGTTINNNMGGEPGNFLYGADAGLPAGWRLDLRTGEASVIPGGPAAVEAAGAEEKGDRKDEQSRLKLGTTLESLNLNIQDVEDGGLPVTGIGGDARRTWLGRLFTGDSAVDFGNRTAQITDSAAFAEIQNMRDNSPTGGAVGQLTDAERTAIGNAVTALNNSTSAGEYVRAAKAYRKLALDLAYGEDTWEFGEDGQPVAKGSADSPTDADGWTTINGVKIRVKQ